MNAIEVEPNTAGAANFTGLFFHKQPVDGTKYRVEWHQVLPATGFKEETETVVFNFPALDYPYSYEISDLLLSVKFNIYKDDGTLPDKTESVCGINNMLHSLFSKVNLKINGEEITNSPEFYYYKAYLENLLTFNKDTKGTWLQSSGYSEDMYGTLWHTNTNSGYINRTIHFRKQLHETGDFSQEGKQ